MAGDGGITVGDESLRVELRREEERRVWLGEAAILLGGLITIPYGYHWFSRIMRGPLIASLRSTLMEDVSVLEVAPSHFALLGESNGITTPSRGFGSYFTGRKQQQDCNTPINFDWVTTLLGKRNESDGF